MRRLYDEVGNKKDLDLLDEIVSESTIVHDGFPGMPDKGPEAYRATFGMSFAALPDFHMTIDDLIAERDKVVARVTVTGTHQGEFMGIPATDKAIKIASIEIFEMKDGKFTAHWNVIDRAGLMEQLGVAPAM